MKLGQILPRIRVDLPPPKVVGLTFLKARSRFKPLRMIGKGVFGVAYSGALRGRKVIIKVACGPSGVITPQEAIEYSKREIRILGRLQKYPFVPRVFEVGIDYFVMEDVDGISLLDITSSKRRGAGLEAREILSTVVALGIIASIFHRNDVAHNDLEPRNILLTPNGVVVIDFGTSLTPEDGKEEFIAARERDIMTILHENLGLVFGSSTLPTSIRYMISTVIEKYRKIVQQRKVDENTAREISQELIFALAQLGARARRRKKLSVDRVKTIAV